MPVVKPLTYKDHKQRWKDCKRCELCKGRKRVVLARGKLPCDVLLIGEAPGESEDTAGVPFYGPAGKLLDRMIATAFEGTTATWAMTNIIACIPRDDDSNKLTTPPKYAVEACAPRLVEFAQIVNPSGVVLVGKEAAKAVPGQTALGFSDTKIEVEFAEITHPAAILRADVTQRGLLIQRNTIAIAELVNRL